MTELADAVYVLGQGGRNTEIPLLHAFQTSGSETLTKLDASGRAVFSTYLGGSSAPQTTDPRLSIDAADNSYVVGATRVGDLTTFDAVQPTFGGNEDAYATELDASGAPVFSTYFGGSDVESTMASGVDASGVLRISGNTASTDLATRSAAQPRLGGTTDFFAAAIGPQ